MPLGSSVSSGVIGGGVFLKENTFLRNFLRKFKEILKENKTPTFVVFFHWKRRIRRKWQVERERERKRNVISLKLWFV